VCILMKRITGAHCQVMSLENKVEDNLSKNAPFQAMIGCQRPSSFFLVFPM